MTANNRVSRLMAYATRTNMLKPKAPPFRLVLSEDLRRAIAPPVNSDPIAQVMAEKISQDLKAIIVHQVECVRQLGVQRRDLPILIHPRYDGYKSHVTDKAGLRRHREVSHA